MKRHYHVLLSQVVAQPEPQVPLTLDRRQFKIRRSLSNP
jgi:hypothetical protein